MGLNYLWWLTQETGTMSRRFDKRQKGLDYILIVLVAISQVTSASQNIHSNDNSLSRPEQTESRLLNHLLTNYDKRVRPILNVTNNITIYLGITLTQIVDMDEKNQVMTTNVWLDQEWFDELLTWNPLDYGNISQIRIPCDEIWLPDIVLYNNGDDFTTRYMRSLALVRNDGKVFWSPPIKFRSTCQVDVTYFPFDDQTCRLKLGSWMHDGYSVDIQTRTPHHIDMSGYVPSGEWKLLQRPKLTRRDRYYPCCPEPFPEISVKLRMRRKTIYYMYNIIVPCIMISALTVLIFCLPPDSREKITFGATVLLIFSVFMSGIADKMPQTSGSSPLIGKYLTFVMATTCVSVIMAVIVRNLFYRGQILTPVPIWIQRYILRKKMPRTTSILDLIPVNSADHDPTSVENNGSAHIKGEEGPDYIGDCPETDRNRTITMMADKNRDEETLNMILQDWKLLAQKVDCVLVWIVLLIITILSVLFIFVIPKLNYISNDQKYEN